MNIVRRIELAIRWQLADRQALAELETYTERQLSCDLKLMRSDLPGIAAEEADERIAAYVSNRPGYLAAWNGASAGFSHG
jgi:hypothetical protein